MSVLARIDGWPVDTSAAGVTSATKTLDLHGPTDQVFPLASVTKPLAAYAVLIAAEEGELHLDEPAGPEDSTVRHLLAHASGLPPQEGGPVSPVGYRRVYSNWGYHLLGELVSQRTGESFADYLDLAVLEPLGMASTTLDGSPAAAASGTVEDLLRFGRELLAPTLLSEEAHATATSVAFPGLAGVLPGFGRHDPNDWGLGFEIRDGKSPHWTGEHNSPRTFGHFGQSGSFLWVDPDAGLACASLSDRPFDEWAADVWPALSDAVLDAYA